MGDAIRDGWNRRYREEARTEEPSPFLRSAAHLLPAGGTALDVAGGNGRNGIWLAERGFEVTVVDIAQAGLELAADLSRRRGVVVSTVLADLEEAPLPVGPWDLIVCFHYLQRSLFPQFAARLRPGGLLVAEIATRRNLERHDRPPAEYVLEEGEAPDLLPPLEAILYNECWTEANRHEARIIARRPGGAAQSDASARLGAP